MRDFGALFHTQLPSDRLGYATEFVGWEKDEKHPLNELLLLVPFAVTALSAATLVSGAIAHRVVKSRRQAGDAQESNLTGRSYVLSRIIAQNGGAVGLLFGIARVLGSGALVGLSVPAVLEDISKQRWFDISGRIEERPYELLLLANVYAFVLATFAVTATKWRTWFIRSNITVLVAELGVYGYRDVWPLATFKKHPADISEGWLLWTRIGVLVFTSIFIPLFIPSVYVPIDPKNPSEDVHPEQTASIASLYTYEYLSPMISAANKTAHLTPDQFPPIADYDRAQALSNVAYPHLDPVKVRKGRHIFFGLLRVFYLDYLSAVFAMTIFSLSHLLMPLAINQLLTFLESGGTKPTIIRPWFWILCLFLAPAGISIAAQSYTLTMTRTLVRMESILTQLIFDYSLRVRVKAESSEQNPTSEASEAAQVAVHESRDATLVDTTDNEASETAETDRQASKSKAKAKDDAPAPPKSKNSSNFIGKLNNLATVDLNNLTGARDLALLFYLLPFQLIGCSIFLYFLLGWSAFVGLATMVILLPVPAYVIKLMQDVQREKMKKTDNRTQTVTESMNVLRMVKMFGWEDKIFGRIEQRREEELSWIWKGKLLGLFVQIATDWIPTLTMLITYATAALVMRMELTSSKVFSSMILFENIRNELVRSNYVFTGFIKGKVSIDRFNAFFKETELLDSFEGAESLASGDLTVSEGVVNDVAMFKNASFIWSPGTSDGDSTPSSQFKLTVPGELQFAPGKINIIVGPTGSGKTSLLMALLGEMHFTPSHPDSMYNLPRAGGISFAVQESWVQNETIRDNILFNSAYDEERYKKVLYQCALEQDLELFEAGDKTEVGERGLTLSGGQKARLTLARAIYSRAEIILLDDILAALDVHTSKWIVNKCLLGDLVQGRTVLLVTHNIALAGPIADFIVSVSAGGVVSSRGRDLSAVLLADPALKAEFKHDEAAIAEESDEINDKESKKDRAGAGKLIIAEEIQQGTVSWKPISLLLKSIGGDRVYLFFALWTVGSLGESLMHTLSVWFMGYWSSQYKLHSIDEIPLLRYIGIYVGFAVLQTVSTMTKEFQWMKGTIRASRTIHRMLTRSILGSTLRWLDETPISRVITRMTQDINSLDGSLVQTLEAFANLILIMIVDLNSAVFFVPIFTIPGLFIALLGTYIGSRYLKAQLSVKREKSNAKAPMLAHFGAAMAGLVSIRAYGAQATFQVESRKRIDHYVKIARLNFDLDRWVGIRIEILGASFTASLAAYLTYGSNIGAANVGFSLGRAVHFCSVILYTVRFFNAFQVEANSMERIVQYIDIEQEPKPTEDGRPPAAWPTSGDIKVEGLTARYSKTGPTVLHGLTFNLNPGERVGVVGRTGSGKSSLTLALLRCILTEGTVHFDGVPTDQINLNALRSNITIIPQLPELLSGTLRYNLDPFGEHDDATLNSALRSSGLYAATSESGEARLGLDSNIASGGANISVGQRQIIALARAIVRSSKLLILDEATSAIDHDTDSIIQNTLRRELGSDVTVLTIAHRLQTIMDADRVMVLDAGRIVEFASPADLLKIEGGVFKALVDESGDKDKLYAVAAKVASTSRS